MFVSILIRVLYNVALTLVRSLDCSFLVVVRASHFDQMEL